MEKTYIIAWRSDLDPVFHRGTKHFTREEAEGVAKELNQAHPGIVHEPIDVGSAAVPIA